VGPKGRDWRIQYVEQLRVKLTNDLASLHAKVSPDQILLPPGGQADPERFPVLLCEEVSWKCVMSSEVPCCIEFMNIELRKLANGLVHETRFGLVISLPFAARYELRCLSSYLFQYTHFRT
jgi:hypothetical protein